MLPPAMPKTMSMPASSSTRTIPSAARVSAVISLSIIVPARSLDCCWSGSRPAGAA